MSKNVASRVASMGDNVAQWVVQSREATTEPQFALIGTERDEFLAGSRELAAIYFDAISCSSLNIREDLTLLCGKQLLLFSFGSVGASHVAEAVNQLRIDDSSVGSHIDSAGVAVVGALGVIADVVQQLSCDPIIPDSETKWLGIASQLLRLIVSGAESAQLTRDVNTWQDRLDVGEQSGGYDDKERVGQREEKRVSVHEKLAVLVKECELSSENFGQRLGKSRGAHLAGFISEILAKACKSLSPDRKEFAVELEGLLRSFGTVNPTTTKEGQLIAHEVNSFLEHFGCCLAFPETEVPASLEYFQSSTKARVGLYLIPRGGSPGSQTSRSIERDFSRLRVIPAPRSPRPEDASTKGRATRALTDLKRIHTEQFDSRVLSHVFGAGEPTVGAFQRYLRTIAGKEFASLPEKRTVCTLVNACKRLAGVELLFDGTPCTVKAVSSESNPHGSFQLRQSGGAQKTIGRGFGSSFPPLSVRAIKE